MNSEKIKKLYSAMSENGFNELELEIGGDEKIRLVLETQTNECFQTQGSIESINESEDLIEKTQLEIRSDKVGVFHFTDKKLELGMNVEKGEILGSIKGISFKDNIKCVVGGTLSEIHVQEGTVVDFGKLLFILDLNNAE
jgi:biotin carboxyl carrier protein